MIPFDVIWQRIKKYEGNEFKQKLGKTFVYKVNGNILIPSTTNISIAKTQFEKAWERMPIEGPGEISDLIGPSYLYAILNDQRICNS